MKEIQLNDKEKSYFLHLLTKLDEICTKHNLTYFLYAGSLLGQARMGKIIPWDDDLDIAMEVNHLIKFTKIVNSNESNGLIAYARQQGALTKFYSDINYTVKHSRWI